MTYNKAYTYAAQFLGDFEYYIKSECEFTGEIRRKETEIKKIEIIVRAYTEEITNYCKEKALRDKIVIKYSGNWLKKFDWLECGLEVNIFIANPVNYGIIHLLSTGNKHFNRKIMCEIRKHKHYYGGSGLGNYQLNEYLRKNDGTVVETQTEQDVFCVLKKEFIKPELRKINQKGEVQIF